MKKRFVRTGLILLTIGVVVTGLITLYLFNMPHRDVISTEADQKIRAGDLVREYLSDPAKANEKYLAEDGDSRILAVTGTILEITMDMNDQKVILLKDGDQPAGVSCTFTHESGQALEHLQAGDMITVKGVIRSGASYDEDLEMYEHAILEKCSLTAS